MTTTLHKIWVQLLSVVCAAHMAGKWDTESITWSRRSCEYRYCQRTQVRRVIHTISFMFVEPAVSVSK